MPTKKPRVWVTLEPEAYEVLKGMAKLGNSNPGRVLSEIASPVLPALKRLVDAANDFAAWERSLKTQLAEVHQDVVAGIDAAIMALEARKAAPRDQGVDPGAVSPVGASEAPVGPTGEVGPGCASMPRSAKPGPTSEASASTLRTPPTNRGVIRRANKQYQRVKKGGPSRGI